VNAKKSLYFERHYLITNFINLGIPLRVLELVSHTIEL